MSSEDTTNGWIRTSEQMPEGGSRTNVLFYNRRHDKICLGWYEASTLCWISGQINSSFDSVPFWKPLPDLPEHLISFKDPSIAKKISAQHEYCHYKKKHYAVIPRFGECFGCQKQIFNKITLRRASYEVITKCPYCDYNFTD